MRDREPDSADRGRGSDPSDSPGTEAPLGRLAGKIVIAGIIGMAYVFLRPG